MSLSFLITPASPKKHIYIYFPVKPTALKSPPIGLAELSESSSNVDMALKNLITLIHCLPLNKMLQQQFSVVFFSDFSESVGFAEVDMHVSMLCMV